MRGAERVCRLRPRLPTGAGPTGPLRREPSGAVVRGTTAGRARPGSPTDSLPADSAGGGGWSRSSRDCWSGCRSTAPRRGSGGRAGPAPRAHDLGLGGRWRIRRRCGPGPSGSRPERHQPRGPGAAPAQRPFAPRSGAGSARRAGQRHLGVRLVGDAVAQVAADDLDRPHPHDVAERLGEVLRPGLAAVDPREG